GHPILVPDISRYKCCGAGYFGIGSKVDPPCVTCGDAHHRTAMEEALDDVAAEQPGSAEDGHQRHIKCRWRQNTAILSGWAAPPSAADIRHPPPSGGSTRRSDDPRSRPMPPSGNRRSAHR